VSCPVNSEDKGADEIRWQARRAAESVPYGTVRPRNAAWRLLIAH